LPSIIFRTKTFTIITFTSITPKDIQEHQQQQQQQLEDRRSMARSTTFSPSTNGTYPHITVKRSKPNSIQFAIDGTLCLKLFNFKSLKVFIIILPHPLPHTTDERTSGPLTTVKLIIFASKPIANNSKLIEVPLAKNGDNGVWSYELANTPLSGDDEIEYWMYAEMYGVGYFSNDVVKLRGN
jgi:hypothetical protein